MQGRIHSIQTLGTLDGPGVRFVVFLQGCHLRCGCCHNPDTWDLSGGTLTDAQELADKAVRYREYFGKDGGVTLSGGEPLLQTDFAIAFFKACHERGLHCCLDTSGSIVNENTRQLLAHTDRVLLDIKYDNDILYHQYVGCSIEKPLEFLRQLNENNIPTTLRQVIIPSLNDNDESIMFLRRLAENHGCVDGVELLPFKKVCTVKYDSLGIPFPFAEMDTPSAQTMARLQKALTGD